MAYIIPSRWFRRVARNSRLQGFTAVELIVVVAILATLAALFLPAIGGSMEKNREIKCASNMRRISELIFIYSSDNNGNMLPHVDAGNRFWPDVLAAQYTQNEKKPAGNYDIFYCPSMVKRGYTHEKRSALGYRTTYAANWSLMRSEELGANKLSLFSKPSRTGVLWDGRPWVGEVPYISVGAVGEYHLEAKNPNSSVGWLHGRKEKYPERLGRVNVLFLDGHVESQKDPGDGRGLDIGVNWPNLYPE